MQDDKTTEEKGYRAYRVLIWLETGWLVFFGFVVLQYAMSGRLRLLLSPSWNWLIITVSFLSLLLGAGTLLLGREREERYIDYSIDLEGGKEYVYRALGLAALFAVLVVSLVVPGRSLTSGIQTGDPQGFSTFSTASESEIRLAEEKEDTAKGFKDWVIITAEDPEPSDHEGKEVTITGMALRMDGLAPGEFYLIRYLFTHCVACARPIGFLCRVTGGQEVPKTDQWVEVEGVFDVGEYRGERVPLIDIDRYKVVKPPSDPYIYP